MNNKSHSRYGKESLISIQSTEIEDDENNQQETEDVSQNVDGIKVEALTLI